jgi:hypothetical protein
MRKAKDRDALEAAATRLDVLSRRGFVTASLALFLPRLGRSDDLTDFLRPESADLVLIENRYRTWSIPNLLIVRREDMLWLNIALDNVKIVHRLGRSSYLRRINLSKPAVAAIGLGPQHIFEQSFFDDPSKPPLILPLTAQTRLANPTRLLFQWDLDEIPLRIENLLDWKGWRNLVVQFPESPNAIAEPDSNKTNIELPYRVTLSPAANAQWRNEVEVVTRNGLTEMWRASLTSSAFNVPAACRKDWTTAFPGSPVAEVSASWSPDFLKAGQPDCTALPDDPSQFPNMPWPTTSCVRHDLVTLSHVTNTCPVPIESRVFALSPFGAIADVEGHWPYLAQRTVTALDRMVEKIELGQDTFIEVDYRGYLYPLSHAATCILQTPREEEETTLTNGAAASPSQSAYLRTRLYIRLKEQTKTFTCKTFPFRTITFDYPETPKLDAFTDPQCVIQKSAGGTWGQQAFWPSRGGTHFLFACTATDWDGNISHFHLPLVFIEFSTGVLADPCPWPPPGDKYLPRLRDVTGAYRNACADSTVPMAAQSVAVTESVVVRDTTVEILNIQFDSIDDTIPPCTDPHPQFLPVAARIQARLPALKGVLSEAANTGWYVPKLVDKSAAGIFLQIDDTLSAANCATPTTQPAGDYYCHGESKKFQPALPPPACMCPAGNSLVAHYGVQTQQSGAFAGPIITVAGTSRKYGPYGDGLAADHVKDAKSKGLADDQFDARRYLDLGTKLFGSFTFSDLLAITPIGQAGGGPPQILSELVSPSEDDPYISQRFEWSTSQLVMWPGDDVQSAIFIIKNAASDADPDRKTPDADPTTLAILVEATITAGGDGLHSTFSAVASLKNFCLQFAIDGNGVLVRFHGIYFTAATNQKTHLDTDIADVSLVGPVMSFIKTLEDFLNPFSDDGIRIDVSATGVLITLPSLDVPTISVGIFSLENLSIKSSLTISFKSDPTIFQFNFSDEAQPFELTVSIFGGGGWLMLCTDGKQIVSFAASFRFGVHKTLSLGGIATGYIDVSGGLTYRSSQVALGSTVEYDAFVHLEGSATALGFISIGVCFDVVLWIRQWPECQAGVKLSNSEMRGRVTVSYSVTIGFFHKSFSIEYEQQFSGSSKPAGACTSGAVAAKALEELKQATAPAANSSGHSEPPSRRISASMTLDDWMTYEEAFAA